MLYLSPAMKKKGRSAWVVQATNARRFCGFDAVRRRKRICAVRGRSARPSVCKVYGDGPFARRFARGRRLIEMDDMKKRAIASAGRSPKPIRSRSSAVTAGVPDFGGREYREGYGPVGVARPDASAGAVRERSMIGAILDGDKVVVRPAADRDQRRVVVALPR